MVHRSRVALTVIRPVAWLVLLLGVLLFFAGVGMAGKAVLSGGGPGVVVGVQYLLVGVGLLVLGLGLRQLTRPPMWSLRRREQRDL